MTLHDYLALAALVGISLVAFGPTIAEPILREVRLRRKWYRN